MVAFDNIKSTTAKEYQQSATIETFLRYKSMAGATVTLNQGLTRIMRLTTAEPALPAAPRRDWVGTYDIGVGSCNELKRALLDPTTNNSEGMVADLKASLSEVTCHSKALEEENSQLRKERDLLKAQVSQLEGLVATLSSQEAHMASPGVPGKENSTHCGSDFASCSVPELKARLAFEVEQRTAAEKQAQQYVHIFSELCRLLCPVTPLARQRRKQISSERESSPDTDGSTPSAEQLLQYAVAMRSALAAAEQECNTLHLELQVTKEQDARRMEQMVSLRAMVMLLPPRLRGLQAENARLRAQLGGRVREVKTGAAQAADGAVLRQHSAKIRQAVQLLRAERPSAVPPGVTPAATPIKRASSLGSFAAAAIKPMANSKRASSVAMSVADPRTLFQLSAKRVAGAAAAAAASSKALPASWRKVQSSMAVVSNASASATSSWKRAAVHVAAGMASMRGAVPVPVPTPPQRLVHHYSHHHHTHHHAHPHARVRREMDVHQQSPGSPMGTSPRGQRNSPGLALSTVQEDSLYLLDGCGVAQEQLLGSPRSPHAVLVMDDDAQSLVTITEFPDTPQWQHSEHDEEREEASQHMLAEERFELFPEMDDPMECMHAEEERFELFTSDGSVSLPHIASSESLQSLLPRRLRTVVEEEDGQDDGPGRSQLSLHSHMGSPNSGCEGAVASMWSSVVSGNSSSSSRSSSGGGASNCGGVLMETSPDKAGFRGEQPLRGSSPEKSILDGSGKARTPARTPARGPPVAAAIPGLGALPPRQLLISPSPEGLPPGGSLSHSKSPCSWEAREARRRQAARRFLQTSPAPPPSVHKLGLLMPPLITVPPPPGGLLHVAVAKVAPSPTTKGGHWKTRYTEAQKALLTGAASCPELVRREAVMMGVTQGQHRSLDLDAEALLDAWKSAYGLKHRKEESRARGSHPKPALARLFSWFGH